MRQDAVQGVSFPSARLASGGAWLMVGANFKGKKVAERVLISLEDVSLSFGGKPLFEELNLYICEGDKICLVGKNGAGKTTLMRLITGEMEADSGRRFALAGVSVGYLAQNVPHDARQKVKDFVLSGLPQGMEPESQHHLADQIMEPLGLAGEALLGTLSGGQLRRAALARALITAPDVLLLDEPTNHLDLAGIEWLEQYLAAYRGALVCVSHDRAFLKAISRKVFWIDRGMIRTCPKGYAEFDDWAEQVIAQEARELNNMKKTLAAEVDWTQGGVTGRRKRNIRRLRELYRLRDKLKADKAAYAERMRKIELDPFTSAPASKAIVEFKGVSKSFGKGRQEIPILKDFDFRILRGDRIGILGRNGSGKSTFIKLLTGELEPDAGRVVRGKSVEITYFDQNRSELDPNKTLWTTLAPGGDYVMLGSAEKPRPIHVCGYLKNFLFDPRMARDRVSTLSGGQANRLMLAKVLAHPGNVLILDEPTNDLDMDTLDMLQEILAEYEGTLLVVSHDRDFLDRTVTELLAFEGNAKVEGHMGGYTDYQEAVAKREEATVRKSAAPAKAVAAEAERKGRTKMSFKLIHELEKLPGRMEALQLELAELKALLEDADFYTRDPAGFDRASVRYGEAQDELAEAEMRWLELEEMKGAG